MASLALSLPGIFDRVAASTRNRGVRRGGKPAPEAPADDAWSRRDFVQEMLTRRPDAFAGELDVQHMMQLCPGRF